MAKIPEMTYKVENDAIVVALPLTSQGKFRCKTRADMQDFGDGFAPKTTTISSDAYLEWQIGYDTIIGKDVKPTKLDSAQFEFTGANKKRKYPYELSEIAYFMHKQGILTDEDMDEIDEGIAAISEYLQDKYSIEVHKEDPVSLNNIDFLTSSTKLPTFITSSDNKELMIEIMISKQQYATGVQPMLYFVVPMTSFENSNRIVGYTSSETPVGFLKLDESNKDVIKKLFICFAMCSASHNHDVKEILKVINR